MTPAEGQDALRELIQSFLDHPRDMGVRAPCGLGKTSIFVEEFKRLFWEYDGAVEYYVPTHALADEVLHPLRYGPTDALPVRRWHWQEDAFSGIAVKVIRGRDNHDRYGNPFCRKHRLAEELSRKGISVFPHLCMNVREATECRHYGRCRYINQFSEEDTVRIYTHAHLGIPRGFLDNELPEFAVIDESFYATLLKHKTIRDDDLFRHGFPRDLRRGLFESFQGRSLNLDDLQESLGDELHPMLQEAQRSLRPPRIEIRPDMRHHEQSQRIRSLRINPSLQKLVEILAIELETGREYAHGITRSGEQINIHWRDQITRFDNSHGSSPVLAIDADLKREIHATFFPDAECHHIPVTRHCNVTQVCSTRCSTTSLAPCDRVGGRAQQQANTRISDIQRLINREVELGRVLVIGPQAVTGNPGRDVEPLLHVPSDSALAHFGSIRGMDAFRDFDAVVIIGRNQPSLQGLEIEARALWFDSEVPLAFAEDWEEQPRGYRLRQSEPAGVNVLVHPDQCIQLLHEQIRESESTQAIDRLRLIHNETPKRIIVLSNIVLDLTVDRLVTWPDLMRGDSPLVQAWRSLGGVMPLSRNWLATEFPKLFPTERVARYQTGRRLMDNISKIISISYCVHLIEYEYRLEGSRGRAQRCLSQYTLRHTRAELQDLHDRTVSSIRRVRLHEGVATTSVAESDDPHQCREEPASSYLPRHRERRDSPMARP